MAREVDGMVTATGGSDAGDVARRSRALHPSRVTAAPLDCGSPAVRPRCTVHCNARVGASSRQILPAPSLFGCAMWDCRCMDHQILTINNMVVVLLARAHRQ